MSSAGGCVPSWIADGYCDDENNTPECEFDGGDCCDNDQDDWDFYCNDCECLDQGGCAVPEWFADGYCDDENNTPECDFDGGDCCDNDMEDWDYYCNECECFDNDIEIVCEVPDWFADGYCDDENNTPECDFDGGDCCDN